MGLRDSLASVAITARTSLVTVTDAALGRSTDARADANLASWARALFRTAGVELDVTGQEHAEPGEPFVIMSNHASHFDVPIVFCAVPGPMRMIAKKELFQIPVFGRAMTAAGFVRIDRSDHARAVASLDACLGLLTRGTRVWIAPEGTRSRDGALLPFKSGGFHLALDAGVRILPVALIGTAAVVARGSAVVHHGQTVGVRILPPIDPRAWGLERKRELVATVRDAIAGALTSG